MDSVTAAAYNVIFTSVPILIFAVVDRPVQHFETLIRYPQASSLGSPWQKQSARLGWAYRWLYAYLQFLSRIETMRTDVLVRSRQIAKGISCHGVPLPAG